MGIFFDKIEVNGKQAGKIRRRATFHEDLEHFVKYYVFTILKKNRILSSIISSPGL